MTRAQYVEYYTKKSQDQDFEFDQIRSELESQNLPEQEVDLIIRLVDNAIQHRAISKTNKNRSRELTAVGTILTLIGAGITLGSLFGILDLGGSIIITFGPLGAGATLLGAGRITSRR